MDGLYARPPGTGWTRNDGKYHGCQARLRRRAEKARTLGPSRLLVRTLGPGEPGGPGELLECGHVGPVLPVTHPKTPPRPLHRRCAGCRDWEARASQQIDRLARILDRGAC